MQLDKEQQAYQEWRNKQIWWQGNPHPQDAQLAAADWNRWIAWQAAQAQSAERIAQLEANLASRDDFLVTRDLFDDYCRTLVAKSALGEK